MFGCRLTVSQLPLKQWYEGSTPSTRAFLKCELGSEKFEIFGPSKFSPQTSYGSRPVLVQELGCEPSPCRFNSDRPPLEQALGCRR